MARRAATAFEEARPEGNGRAERGGGPSGLFMAGFLSTCLLISLLNPALRQPPDEPLLDGSWASAFQAEFDRQSLLFTPATNLWGVIEYTLFRQGRSGVLVGEDDWLYSREEFVYPAREADAAQNLAANLSEVARLDAKLHGQGVELVVALLPAKARIYPEHLGRYRLPAGPLGRYREALTGWRERGVTAVGLERPLLAAKVEGDVFLRTDTHWTPFGAAVAAAAVAEAVERRHSFPWLHDASFETRREEEVALRGDLAQFLPLGPLYETVGPPDDRLRLISTESTTSAGNDLFAAVEIPVVLIGTSYSEDDRWNFAGALRQSLGSDVLVAAERGRGPYAPMIEYLESEAFRSSPPEMVLWEIPERYLSERWSRGEEDR